MADIFTRCGRLVSKGYSSRITPKLEAILIGSTISIGLTLIMWAFKLMPALIWITLPGWLFSWALIIVLHAEHWKHFDTLGLTLLTIGNAAFYSWLVGFLAMRPKK